MICAHCNHFAAIPGGTLCAQCAVVPPPLPTAPVVRYQGAPNVRPGASLGSPVALGRAAAAALGLVIAADLFAVWADFLRIDVTGDILDGALGSDVVRRAGHSDDLSGIASAGQVTSQLICMVMYLCWFYRVRVNAEVFDPFVHSKSRGWTIGGWFTPVVNLWFPRQIAAEIWTASVPWGERRSTALVNIWWGLWLFTHVTDQFAAVSDRHAETTSELRDAARTMMFSDVTDIVAAVLAIAVVLRLTRMQHHKALAGPLPV